MRRQSEDVVVAVLGGAGRAAVYDLAGSGRRVRLLESDEAAARRVAEGGRSRARKPLDDEEDFAFEIGVPCVHASLHSEVATLPTTYAAKGIEECSFTIIGLLDHDATHVDRAVSRRPSRCSSW